MITAPDKVCFVSDITKGEIRTNSFAENYPLNILIAEDNFVNLKLIERILYKLGYQTDTASDGIQVINSFSKKEHNVILMDVRMPHMDGYETTRRIRSGEAGRSHVATPIIAMTANAMQGDRQRCLDAGMNDYVPKPVNAKAVAEALNKCLVGKAPDAGRASGRQ